MHLPDGPFAAEWDLGDQWCRWSELPFVFAMWVARQESADRGSGSRRQDPEELNQVATVLSQARDAGLANVEQIARVEHARYSLSYDDCLTYLRDHLHFTLGPRELSGLRLFYDHAAKMRLAPAGRFPFAGTKPGSEGVQRDVISAVSGTRFGS